MSSGMTRRQFIVRTAALGAAVPSIASLLAACADSSESTTTAITVSPPVTDDISPFAGSYTITDVDTGTMVSVTVADGIRTIESNGLPNHATGEFPNSGNPNTISAQAYSYSLPELPAPAADSTAYNVPQSFGIAVNGVPIDPFAAEWYDNDPASGWQLNALANSLGFDVNNAHVQPTGAYHYHGPVAPLVTATDRPVLIGWAGDGFPIYAAYGYTDPSDSTSPVTELHSSYQLKAGERSGGPSGTHDGTYIEDYEYVAGSGDLDECNGRFGVTPEHPDGVYQYVASNQWPYYGRFFKGGIDESFVQDAPAGGPADIGGANGAPPGVDLETAAATLGVSLAQLQAALGAAIPPDFAAAAATLGVSEADLRSALGAPAG